MTQASGDDLDARKLAAIVAAVQAYLDGETRGSRRGSGEGMSAWRRVVRQAHHEPTGRSWTGRD